LYEGKFVLVRRGDCTFEAKALNLNALGASAMIVGNNDGGIVHMPGSQNLDIDIASVMVNNYTAAYLETLVSEKRGSSADGSISSALVPISCGTNEDLFKLNLISKLDGESDQEYQCLTPVEDERKLMDVVEGGVLRFGNSEVEYLTASFGGPSLGKQYPFYVAGNACETKGLEQVAGKIAVVNRGDCELLKKAESVQEAGGIAMVLVNDGPGLSRIATSSQWESAHVVIHAVMASESSGETLIAAIEAEPELMGEFQGGRVKESEWKEVVDLMNLDNWPTSKRKGKALYASMREIHAGNPDRLACLEAGWQAFKDDHGIKEEL
jgi:hypothetical protein